MLGRPRVSCRQSNTDDVNLNANSLVVSALKRRVGELELELRNEQRKNERLLLKKETSWPIPFDELNSVDGSPPREKDVGIEDKFKLSSQVLVLQGSTIGGKQTSLKRIITESSGRSDTRGQDTPLVGPVGCNAMWRPECNETSSDDEQPQQYSSKLTIQFNECMSPSSLDRIISTKSLSVLETSHLSDSTIPPASQQAMSYLSSVYDSKTNTFNHKSEVFLSLAHQLCSEASVILESEPLYAKIKTPCYVFGDIHGNYADLSYFLTSVVAFKNLMYSTGNLLFLGDYVDRGDFGLECVVLLLALKISAPNRVLLLRGNHEDPLVNGDTKHYGSTSFQKQCTDLFGLSEGFVIWKAANSLVFKNLPLSADIDGKIFCTHGGIPRFSGGLDTRSQDLKDPDFPRLDSFSTFKDDPESTKPWVQITCDLCWSDPKERESNMDDFGFTDNNRGSGTICFGKKAVDDFLSLTGYEYIVRAHQEKSDGLRLSKSARVITIFSSSDYEGHRNGAGLLFINEKREIRMIIKKAV